MREMALFMPLKGVITRSENALLLVLSDCNSFHASCNRENELQSEGKNCVNRGNKLLIRENGFQSNGTDCTVRYITINI